MSSGGFWRSHSKDRLARLFSLLYTCSASSFVYAMLVIRLQRTGRENTPTFRIVVSEKTRSAKKGQHEILGHFLANRETPVFQCDTERVAYWISKGAKPSDTMARLLKRHGGMKDMEKFIIRYAKQASRKEVPKDATPAAPAPTAEAAPAPTAEAAPAPTAAPEVAAAPAA